MILNTSYFFNNYQNFGQNNVNYILKEKKVLVKAKFHSSKKGEINRFLSKFYNIDLGLENDLIYEKEYSNPIELSDIIGVYIDNQEKYDLHLWICLDKNIFIYVTNSNANEIIKYLFERYPY